MDALLHVWTSPRASSELERLFEELAERQRELEAQNHDLRTVQRELAESHDRYFDLFERAPISYLSFDSAGTILEANFALASLLDRPRTSFLGHPLVELLAPEHAERFQLELKRLFERRRRIAFEVQICRPDGTRRHVRLDAVSRDVHGPSRPQARAVMCDVDEVKRAEQRIRLLNQELAARIDELTATNDALAREIEQRALLTRTLERNQDQLRQLSRELIASQEDERRRIARELRDETGQTLGAAVAELRALENRGSSAELRDCARQARKDVSTALRDIRRIARGLHPALLASCGLRAALERLFSDLQRRHRIQFTTQLDGLPADERLPLEVELTLFRVAQEAVRHIVSHAPAARATVVLVRHGSAVRLVIEDDRIGFEPPPPDPDEGLGLVRERVGRMGGEMHVESEPDRGTTIAITLPLGPGART